MNYLTGRYNYNFTSTKMEVSQYTDTSSILALVVIGIVSYAIIRQCRRPAGVPPGPNIWPVVGNIPAISGKNLIEAFRDLRKQYGDIYCLRLGLSWVLVINGYDNLKEALVKNGDMFNDRPDNFFFARTLEKKGIIGSSGLSWQEHRLYAMNTLKNFGFGRRSLQENILTETEILLNTLQSINGENFTLKPIIQGVYSNIVASIIFNRRYDYDDPKMLKVRDLLHENLTDSEFSGILDFFPFLEHLPGDIFRIQNLFNVEKKLESFVQEQIDEHKETFDNNNHRDFVDAYLSEMMKKENRSYPTFTERMLVRTCRDLLLAGTDTTATNTRWAVLHMIHKPDIQEKMFNEIKDVIGVNRLPDMNDRTKMPYCDAVCNETLRLSNVGPLSAPRGNNSVVQFKGYTIPAGCVVMPCLDSVLFDENIFPNPEDFIPERFLDGSTMNSKTKFNVAFSLGKRSCMGEVLARQELFLVIVSMVQRFKFLPPKEMGMPKIQRKFGVIFYPEEYKLRAVPR